MAATTVDVYNMALSAARSASKVATPTERSPAADACNRWYNDVRDLIFKTAPWSSLRAYARLSLLKERDDEVAWVDDDPEPGFHYVYGLPSDMAHPRHLADFKRFTIGRRPDGSLALNTDASSPILIYSRRIEDPGAWDPALRQAIVWGLAAHISPQLTGMTSVTQLNFNLASEAVTSARVGDAGAPPQMNYESVPEWIQARGYMGLSPTERYLYPYANFQLTGVGNVG